MSKRHSLAWCLSLSAAAAFTPSRLVPSAKAQAIPSGSTTAPATSSGPSVGFQLPTVGGSLHYALTASELLSTGYYQSSGLNAYTNVGGNVAYVTRSELHPFSVVYGGGYTISTSNSPSSFYQSLSFSQVLNTRRWNIVASDSINYLPSGPTLGLSGVAGVGDLGVPPVQVGAQNGLGILTNYGPRVNNSTTLSVSRRLTGHLSAQGSGSLSLLRFIGDNAQNGLSSTSYSGSGGATYAFNARQGVNANYSYSHFFYTGSPYSFDTHVITAGYNRQIRRDLNFNVYAGPQFVVSTQPGLSNNNGGVGISAGASLSYTAHLFTYSLLYGRGISGGSGVIPGAQSDNASLTASHVFGRSWNTSGSLSYSRSTSLPQFSLSPFGSNSLAVGLQVNRSLTRTLSGFGSYSVIRQGASGPIPVNTFNGLYQVIGFGLTYSPEPLNLSR